MGNQRGTFLKRQREQNLKDKARAKQERLAARREQGSTRTEKGPPMGTFEEQNPDLPDAPPSPVTPVLNTPPQPTKLPAD